MDQFSARPEPRRFQGGEAIGNSGKTVAGISGDGLPTFLKTFNEVSSLNILSRQP